MAAIGARGHDFGRMSAPALAEVLARAGFSCLQLAPRKALLEFEGAERLERGAARAAGAAFAARGLGVAVLGCYVEPVHPDREARRRELARFAESLGLARDFGACLVATETGRLLPGEEAGGARFRELVDAMGGLAREAEREGVWIAVEAVEGHVLGTPRLARELLDAVGSAALRFLLDPANLAPRGAGPTAVGARPAPGARESGGARASPIAPALEALGLLRGSIAAVHAKDLALEAGAKRSLPLGQGILDWRSLLPLIAEAAPDAPILVEDQAPEGLVASRAYIEGVIGRPRP